MIQYYSMSKENPPQDWEQLWIEYNKSLDTWLKAFGSLQKATNIAQLKYIEAMTKALKNSNGKPMNKFFESWQKSIDNAGFDAFKQIGDVKNSASNIQKVKIKTTGHAINDLIALGNSFNANTNLLKDASKILNDLNPKNDKTACGKLGMFINQVNQNHKLTSSQKAQLITATNEIKTSIGCR